MPVDIRGDPPKYISDKSVKTNLKTYLMLERTGKNNKACSLLKSQRNL